VSARGDASIADLGRRLRARELSPVTLVEDVLARIEQRRDLNAFLTVTADLARAQAAEAEREISAGRYRGPLHGIPVSLKDLIDTRGIRTTYGSRIFAEHVPDRDAAVATRLRHAGAVLIGKTALHEFAYGVTNNNPHFGPTRNPWALDRIPGGSSGGAAAAVAAGLGAASIGTDTGGSIRIPAAFCGVVGLKPGYGRVSRHGVFPLAWTLDHVGPLARTVEDAALLLGAIAGPDPRDPTTLGQRVPDFAAAVRRPVDGLCVGVLDDPLHREAAPAVRAAFEEACEVLRTLGLRLEPVAFPRPEDARTAQLTVMMPEAASIHEPWLDARPEDYGPGTLALLRQGVFITAAQYLRAQKVRGLIVDEVDALLASRVALISPTVPITAPAIGQETVTLGGRSQDARGVISRATRLINLVGLPAISVPCGFDGEGLPVGLQIVGRRLDEPSVIAIAAAYERATAWHQRRPPEAAPGTSS